MAALAAIRARLFFSDGINGENDGLFAALRPAVPEPASLALLGAALVFGRSPAPETRRYGVILPSRTAMRMGLISISRHTPPVT